MANSRLEKIGTIFARTKGLLQSGAMRLEDRPLWYDLYEAFPPKEEPRFDKPIPNLPLKKIFYEEDKIRAMLHSKQKNIGTINMFNAKTKTVTQKFIDAYKKIEGQYDKAEPEKIYEEAFELLKKDRESRKDTADEDEHISLARAFQEAEAQIKYRQPVNINVNVKDLFKD